MPGGDVASLTIYRPPGIGEARIIAMDVALYAASLGLLLGGGVDRWGCLTESLVTTRSKRSSDIPSRGDSLVGIASFGSRLEDRARER